MPKFSQLPQRCFHIHNNNKRTKILFRTPVASNGLLSSVRYLNYIPELKDGSIPDLFENDKHRRCIFVFIYICIQAMCVCREYACMGLRPHTCILSFCLSVCLSICSSFCPSLSVHFSVRGCLSVTDHKFTTRTTFNTNAMGGGSLY